MTDRAKIRAIYGLGILGFVAELLFIWWYMEH